jgi:hypothetical protein
LKSEGIFFTAGAEDLFSFEQAASNENIKTPKKHRGFIDHMASSPQIMITQVSG